MSLRKWVIAGSIAAIAMLSFPVEDAFGQRRGGSRSSSKSFSKSKSTTKSTTKNRGTNSNKNKGWNKNDKATTGSNKGWGSRNKGKSSAKKFDSKKTAATGNKKADQALYNRAKANGTSFQSRSQAVDHFKQKNATKYTSKYATKPATRPSHIPQTYSTGGQTYNVTYNSSYGGYGYMDALGTFILYDMMTDSIMMNSMMRNQGYYYGQPPSAYYSSGPNVGAIIGVTVFIIVVGVIVIVLIKQS